MSSDEQQADKSIVLMNGINFNAYLCMIFIVAYEPHPQSHLQVSVYTVFYP